MSQGRPRVTVGVPVFNGELFLAKMLDSLLNQTFSDLEIVISDNASTDRTQEICRRLCRSRPARQILPQRCQSRGSLESQSRF